LRQKEQSFTQSAINKEALKEEKKQAAAMCTALEEEKKQATAMKNEIMEERRKLEEEVKLIVQADHRLKNYAENVDIQ